MAGRFHDEGECWGVTPDIVDSPQRRCGTMAEPPPRPYAPPPLGSVSAGAVSRSTFRGSSPPGSPPLILSTAAGVAPAAPQPSARAANPVSPPSPFRLGARPL